MQCAIFENRLFDIIGQKSHVIDVMDVVQNPGGAQDTMKKQD